LFVVYLKALFNNSEYIASSERMIGLEGLKKPRTPSVRIAGLRAEIGGFC
jgi:hypothetical protein